jgi:hypothetical protein
MADYTLLVVTKYVENQARYKKVVKKFSNVTLKTGKAYFFSDTMIR